MCGQTNVCITYIATRTHKPHSRTHTHTSHIHKSHTHKLGADAQQCKRRQINYESLLSKQADILCLSPPTLVPSLSLSQYPPLFRALSSAVPAPPRPSLPPSLCQIERVLGVHASNALNSFTQ